MAESTLPKNYDPKSIEADWYESREKAGHFAADPASRKAPYTIMMPPPNVTGSLHMGHALTFTLQDLLIRYHRMVGARRAVAARTGSCGHSHADGR